MAQTTIGDYNLNKFYSLYYYWSYRKNNHKDLVAKIKRHYSKKHLEQGIGILEGCWLELCDEEVIFDKEVLVVPVPMSLNRRWQRRFNPVGLLAKGLCRKFDELSFQNALWKKPGPSQANKTLSQRMQNVDEKFVVKPWYKKKLKGRYVIIIDDVVTTGATVMEVARVLRQAGVKKVSILALAH